MSFDFVSICDNLTFIISLLIVFSVWSNTKQSGDTLGYQHMENKNEVFGDLTSGSLLSMKVRLIEVERLVESIAKDIQDLRSYTTMLNQFTRNEVQVVHSRLNKGGDFKREMERIKATVNALWQFTYKISTSSPQPSADIPDGFSLEKQLLPLSKGAGAHSDRYRDPAPVCLAGVQKRAQQTVNNKLHESKCILTAGTRRFDLGTEEGRIQWNKYLSFRKKAHNSEPNVREGRSSLGEQNDQKEKMDENGEKLNFRDDGHSNGANLPKEEEKCRNTDLPYINDVASPVSLRRHESSCAYSSPHSSQALSCSEFLSEAEDSGSNYIEINTGPTTSVCSSKGVPPFSSQGPGPGSKKSSPPPFRACQSAGSGLPKKSSTSILSSPKSRFEPVHLNKQTNQSHTTSSTSISNMSSPRSSLPVRKLHQRERPNSII